jgi:hypothetical protein
MKNSEDLIKELLYATPEECKKLIKRIFKEKFKK